MAMLLDEGGHWPSAYKIIEAIQIVTGTKMKSQSAGRMGYTTSEIGDLVAELVK